MTSNNVELRKELGLFLRNARIDQSLTGKELGDLINISQQQISRYERGQTGINIEMLDLILMTLNKSWGDLCMKVMKDPLLELEYSIKSHLMN